VKLTVSPNNRTLQRDSHHFFYLADTCWSAFTSIQEDDWITYLDKRKEQGFNTVQINILPQWDRSKGTFDMLPYPIDGKKFDFGQVRTAYFERAHKLCQIAEEKGFTLALVVLWSNYVADTWASDLDGGINIISQAERQIYYKQVIDTFDAFQPLYFIGGDTDFPTQDTIDTYLEAFDYFEAHSPETLKTIHIKGRFKDIPASIVSHLDLFLYQSGHNHSFLDMPFTLAEHFYHLEPQLPIINSEPCYEQMGFARQVYGRFEQRDVRKAAWQSILSGGSAGITYGAHGIWSWQTQESAFAEDIGEAFDSPMIWQEALHFPGANDYGYIKQLFELLSIHQLIPCQQHLIDTHAQIRMAITEDQRYSLIYLPSNTKICLRDVSITNVTLVDLKERRFFKPSYTVSDNVTIFKPHMCQEDVLLIIQNKE